MNKALLVLLLTLAALAPPALAAAEEPVAVQAPDYEQEFDHSFAVTTGGGVDIVHSMGSLEIIGWDKPEVRVWAHIMVKGDDAESFAKAMDGPAMGRPPSRPYGWPGLASRSRGIVWPGLATASVSSTGQ